MANELEEMLSDVWRGRHVIVLLSVQPGVIDGHLSLAWEINELTLILATFVH